MTRTREAKRSPAWIGLIAITAFTYIFLLAPIGVVLIQAFNGGELMTFPLQGLSLRWFYAFFADSQFTTALGFSLKLGLAAATMATILGTMAGIGLAQADSASAFLQTLLLSPLYVPRVLVGLALLLTFAWLNVSGSVTGMILAHILITMPYATRTVMVGMRAVSASVQEAARVLGATRWQTFWRVTFPIVRSSVISGFVFALIISFSDIYLALFISGPQSITLPLRLFTFMEWDQSPLVAAASAIQIVIILGIVLIAGRLFGLSSSGRIE